MGNSKANRNHHNRLVTDLFREIRRTKKRFLSLLIMNLLAVGFLAGLRMTAPDMQKTVDEYYDRQHLMDVRIVSSLGLTDEDLEAVSKLEGVEAAEDTETMVKNADLPTFLRVIRPGRLTGWTFWRGACRSPRRNA